MAVDQATFDAALADFLTDITNGLAAIEAKLGTVGSIVDLSPELQQLTDAKNAFDTAVATDTAAAPVSDLPPAERPPDVVPPVVAGPVVDPLTGKVELPF